MTSWQAFRSDIQHYHVSNISIFKTKTIDEYISNDCQHTMLQKSDITNSTIYNKSNFALNQSLNALETKFFKGKKSFRKIFKKNNFAAIRFFMLIRRKTIAN